MASRTSIRFAMTAGADTDFIKLQLNSGVAGIDPGIAGLMFDVIPEPTSLSLVLGGLLAAMGFVRKPQS